MSEGGDADRPGSRAPLKGPPILETLNLAPLWSNPRAGPNGRRANRTTRKPGATRDSLRTARQPRRKGREGSEDVSPTTVGERR
jgi:hypothetical protein